MKRLLFAIVCLLFFSGCGLIKTKALSADDIIRWDVEQKAVAKKQAEQTQRLIDYFSGTEAQK